MAIGAEIKFSFSRSQTMKTVLAPSFSRPSRCHRNGEVRFCDHRANQPRRPIRIRRQLIFISKKITIKRTAKNVYDFDIQLQGKLLLNPNATIYNLF